MKARRLAMTLASALAASSAAAQGAKATGTALSPEEARHFLTSKGVVLGVKPQALARFAEAATRYDVALVEAFLAAGFSPNEIINGRPDNTPFLLAINPGCSLHKGAPAAATIVKAMLAHGADAKVTAANGTSLLLFAADPCPAEVVRVLLEAGADMTARNRAGFDAMTVAVRGGRADVVKVLIDRGYPVAANRAALLQAAQGKPAILALLKAAK